MRQVGRILACVFIFNIKGKKSLRSSSKKARAMAVSSETPISSDTSFWLARMRSKLFTLFFFSLRENPSGILGTWPWMVSQRKKAGASTLFLNLCPLFSSDSLKFVTFVIFLFSKWQFPGDFSLHIISWPFSGRLFLISLPACRVALFYLQVFLVNSFLCELSVLWAVF